MINIKWQFFDSMPNAQFANDEKAEYAIKKIQDGCYQAMTIPRYRKELTTTEFFDSLCKAEAYCEVMRNRVIPQS